MKKLVLAVFLISLLCVSTVFAGSGSAVVPGWGQDATMNSGFIITNITSHDLTVTIEAFAEDGTLIPSSQSMYLNFQNNNTEIGAGKSALWQVANAAGGALHYGSLVIYWKNKGTDRDLYGLIANGNASNGTYSHHIPVNNGKPF